VVLPSGIASTGWPAVRDKCRDFGVAFDPWQDGAGRIILSKRADGSYACSIGGVVISIPRQVGKTFLIAAIVFAVCLLNPGTRVLWTAHHATTADETFQSLLAFSWRKQVRPHVSKRLQDAMTIHFRNGSRIMFGARERGFGRGMTKVGVLVFDEAQILSERAAADMVPTTNTVADALVIYTGTPPKPSDPSELFTNRRNEALSGDSDDMAYIEFSADENAKDDDRKQWAKANPSYPQRTNEAAMLRMKKNLGADSWRREALGIWDAKGGTLSSEISPAQWDDTKVAAAPKSGHVAYGVKFSPDGLTVALAVAMRSSAGVVHVEGVDHRLVVDGTRWLVQWLAVRKHVVAIDGKAGSGALATALLKAGVPAARVKRPTVDEVISAHAGFVDAARAGDVSHIDDAALAKSILAAGRRPIGTAGGWGFGSINGDDVTLAESVVLAHWALAAVKTRSGVVMGIR
jgi:hypothetical protein